MSPITCVACSVLLLFARADYVAVCHFAARLQLTSSKALLALLLRLATAGCVSK